MKYTRETGGEVLGSVFFDKNYLNDTHNIYASPDDTQKTGKAGLVNFHPSLSIDCGSSLGWQRYNWPGKNKNVSCVPQDNLWKPLEPSMYPKLKGTWESQKSYRQYLYSGDPGSTTGYYYKVEITNSDFTLKRSGSPDYETISTPAGIEVLENKVLWIPINDSTKVKLVKVN